MAKNVQIKTWRGKLALLCLRKGLSHQTILDIGYIISDKEWEQGEMLARKAIDIVESVNDEQELLRRIKEL